MEKIKFDPSDSDSLISLMDAYGDSETMYPGETESGDTCTISICKDKIITQTLQKNGWIRTNTYHRDGSSEESYEK